MSLITYVTRIHFADRVIEDALGEELARLGVRRPLVVTDAGAEGDEDLERLMAALPGRRAPVLAADPDMPLTPLARAVRARARAEGCDALLALGGPAALDGARLAGLAGGPDASGPEGGGARPRLVAAPGRWLPVVVVPTLPGQGMGLFPVLRLEPAGEEEPPRSLACDGLVPALVLCDPTLGADLAPARLAASGFDALIHCIEAWLATGWNPPADGIALEGVRRAVGGAFGGGAAALLRAVEAPQDTGARRELLAAGLNAGLAAPKGLGAVHALAHALEAHLRPGLPAADPWHGRLHAALMPHVLAFNAPAVPGRLAQLAQAMGLGPDETPAEALARLGARLGLPGTLAGLGIGPGALAGIARRAEADPANRTNPRLARAADHARLLEAAGAGQPQEQARASGAPQG